MPRTVRSENLDLLRHIGGGHYPLAKRLNSTTNAAYLSKMATGQKEISDYQARRIEELLELPRGWMDRNHEVVHQMSLLLYEIWTSVSELPLEKQQALATLLRAPGAKSAK